MAICNETPTQYAVDFHLNLRGIAGGTMYKESKPEGPSIGLIAFVIVIVAVIGFFVVNNLPTKKSANKPPAAATAVDTKAP